MRWCAVCVPVFVLNSGRLRSVPSQCTSPQLINVVQIQSVIYNKRTYSRCDLWRLATGCYWDLLYRALRRSWYCSIVRCVCFEHCLLKHCSTAYAAEDEINFNFFAVKIVRHVHYAFTASSSSSIFALCFLVHGLLQLADFMFINYGKLWFTTALIVIIVIIMLHIRSILLRKFTFIPCNFHSFASSLSVRPHHCLVRFFLNEHINWPMTAVIVTGIPCYCRCHRHCRHWNVSITLISRCILCYFNFFGSVWIVARTAKQTKTTKN